MVHYLVKINGVYDILCGMSILNFIYIPFLDNMHLQMFTNNENNMIFKRYFAYWIMTYGCIRLSNDLVLVKTSYYIEALFFINELYNNVNIKKEKVLFVILTSLMIGYLL